MARDGFRRSTTGRFFRPLACSGWRSAGAVLGAVNRALVGRMEGGFVTRCYERFERVRARWGLTWTKWKWLSRPGCR